MALTDIEKQIATEVLDHFLTERKPTARKPLSTRFRDPSALDRLMEHSVLRATNTERNLFLPMALAFHHCADETTLHKAKKSLSIVVRTLQQLFNDAPGDHPQFTPTEMHTKAYQMDGEMTLDMVHLGLYLAQEFGVLGGWTAANDELTEFKSVGANEYILPRNAESLWDDRIRQLEPPQQTQAVAPPESNVLLKALRLFCADEVVESLLTNPHAVKSSKGGVAVAFERHVSWLLGLFGFSTIVLGGYEHIVAPETNAQRGSADILASHVDRKLLLVVACTMNPPKMEDFGNLRNACEIVRREALSGSHVRVIPVLFTAAKGCPLCNNDGNTECVPIIGGDKSKELLEFVRGGDEDPLFDFLANPNPEDVSSFLSQGRWSSRWPSRWG